MTTQKPKAKNSADGQRYYKQCWALAKVETTSAGFTGLLWCRLATKQQRPSMKQQHHPRDEIPSFTNWLMRIGARLESGPCHRKTRAASSLSSSELSSAQQARSHEPPRLLASARAYRAATKNEAALKKIMGRACRSSDFSFNSGLRLNHFKNIPKTPTGVEFLGTNPHRDLGGPPMDMDGPPSDRLPL